MSDAESKTMTWVGVDRDDAKRQAAFGSEQIAGEWREDSVAERTLVDPDTLAETGIEITVTFKRRQDSN